MKIHKLPWSLNWTRYTMMIQWSVGLGRYLLTNTCLFVFLVTNSMVLSPCLIEPLTPTGPHTISDLIFYKWFLENGFQLSWNQTTLRPPTLSCVFSMRKIQFIIFCGIKIKTAHKNKFCNKIGNPWILNIKNSKFYLN